VAMRILRAIVAVYRHYPPDRRWVARAIIGGWLVIVVGVLVLLTGLIPAIGANGRVDALPVLVLVGAVVIVVGGAMEGVGIRAARRRRNRP